MMTKFHGTGVALVTPFDIENNVDTTALRNIVDYVINGGVDYIVALGTTGETASLSSMEERLVLDTIIDQVANRVPIVAGNFGGNNTLKVCEKLQSYNFEGIDAILAASPAYVKPSQEGIYQHYKALEQASPLPIIIYNVPGRTSSNISIDTMIRISNISDKIIGVKEASGDIFQGANMVQKCREGFFVTSGDDLTALGLTVYGGVGVISVIANAYPEFSEIFRALKNKDLERANQLNSNYLDIHPLLYVEGNPVGIKALLDIKGVSNERVRLPLSKMSQENKNKLVKALG